MPAILFVKGWKFFFFSNEGNEPIHIHVQKGERSCKYWLDVDNFDIIEAYSYAFSQRDKREVRELIFETSEKCIRTLYACVKKRKINRFSQP